MEKNPLKSIRIGTLVNAGKGDAPRILRTLTPYGFESFQLTFWQTLGGVDLAELAREVKDALAERDAVISSVAVFGNPLENEDKDRETLAGWEQLIDHARDFGCDIVAGFTGRLRGQPIDASMRRYGEIFGPLARRAEDKGVRLAFENCDMGGAWQSGDWNIAHNPTAWETMFNETPGDHLGLCWEPCHQMVSLIDPIPQLKQWVGRVFNVHGKDATIHWDTVKTYGIHGPHPFVFHRTPGFGDSNWNDIITILRQGGFEGSIDIEGYHDPVYRGELEMTGQVRALRYLKECRGGEDFIPNP